MTKGGRTPTYALFSHQFGWELRLTIGELLRMEVCRATHDVLRVQEEWKTALTGRGYALATPVAAARTSHLGPA